MRRGRFDGRSHQAILAHRGYGVNGRLLTLPVFKTGHTPHGPDLNLPSVTVAGRLAVAVLELYLDR